jgi:hypothetical protein
MAELYKGFKIGLIKNISKKGRAQLQKWKMMRLRLSKITDYKSARIFIFELSPSIETQLNTTPMDSSSDLPLHIRGSILLSPSP